MRVEVECFHSHMPNPSYDGARYGLYSFVIASEKPMEAKRKLSLSSQRTFTTARFLFPSVAQS